jgi:hypothetical protein
MTLAWPWSVPRLPFSRAVRPNSDMVTTTVSSPRSPRSVQKAASDWEKSLSTLASWPSVAPSLTWWSQPPMSANATCTPRFALISVRELPQAVAETSFGIIGAGGRRVLSPGRRFSSSSPRRKFPRRCRAVGYRRSDRTWLRRQWRRATAWDFFRLPRKSLMLFMATVGSSAAQNARHRGSERNRAKGRSLRRHPRHGAGQIVERTVEPSVFSGFHAGSAGLHKILRIEVRTRGVGRSGGMNDGEMLLLPERLKRRERGMQAEKWPSRSSTDLRGMLMVGRMA